MEKPIAAVMMPQRKVPTATMMMRLYLSPSIPVNGENRACVAARSQTFTTDRTSASEHARTLQRPCHRRTAPEAYPHRANPDR